MQTLTVAVVGFFAVGYFVLGGADLGVGTLLPFLGRSADERRLVVTAIAPFLLVNKVWQVSAAAFVVGAFPALTRNLFDGLLGAVVALFAGWLVRDAGLWLRSRAGTPWLRAPCDAAVTAGSWVVALSWGWLFVGMLSGATEHLVTGPGVALTAVAIAVLFAAHGLAFAALRLPGPVRERARGALGSSTVAPTLALTSAMMAALCLAVGFRLPLAESAVADPARLTLLVPAALVVAPLLLAAAWVWLRRSFRHPMRRPSCR